MRPSNRISSTRGLFFSAASLPLLLEEAFEGAFARDLAATVRGTAVLPMM